MWPNFFTGFPFLFPTIGRANFNTLPTVAVTVGTENVTLELPNHAFRNRSYVGGFYVSLRQAIPAGTTATLPILIGTNGDTRPLMAYNNEPVTVENLAGTGIPYEGCDGIIIKLSETRFLRGIWRNREKQKAEAPETVPQNESEPAMLAAAQTAEEPMAVVQTMGPVSAAQTVLDAYDDTVLEPQPMPGNEEMRQDEPGVEVQPMPEAEELRQDAAPAGEIQPDLPPHEPATEVPQPMPETEEPQQVEPEAEEQPEPQEPQQAIPSAEEEAQSHEEESAFEAPFLRSQRKMQAGQISPNKWEQLNRIYPKIQPFGDVREYLSIAPCDFVILSEHYQEMVQNSFLLHGYYNYGHLILTKIKEGIDDNYYLGVPGVYYEREKQAALLFGFEGFEGDGDAVQDGSFGYYMKRVEI